MDAGPVSLPGSTTAYRLGWTCCGGREVVDYILQPLMLRRIKERG